MSLGYSHEKIGQRTILLALVVCALLASSGAVAQEAAESAGAAPPEQPMIAAAEAEEELPDLSNLLPEDWPAAKRPMPPTPPAGIPPSPASDDPATDATSAEAPADDAAAPAPSPSGSGRLPWEQRPMEVPDAPVLRPPAGPLEILERFDIGPSRMEGFFNGQPWTPSEEETLIRILYRFPRFGLDNLMRWRKQDVTWDEVVAAPWNYRGQIFRLQGRVKQVSRVTIDPGMAERFELSHYYRVEFELENTTFSAEVLARRVPEAWPLDEPIDEPAAVDALFLKLGEPMESAAPPLIFAAGSVAWFPDRPNAAAGVGPDQLKLIKLGLDWAHFDEQFRKGNGRPILDIDREPFYQLLDIVGREDPNKLLAAGSEPLEVVPLLARPAERHGDIVLVKGIARRIIKVLVEDRDIRARYGIDHYYEIDMFLPLGKTSVRMGKDATGESNPVYNNAFPATLIVRELPPGVVEGENLGEQLETAAIFFKVWSYRSNYTEQFNKMQPAPMFIAQRPESYHELRPANWLTDVFVGGAMGTAALVLILVLWWFQRSDRKHRQDQEKGFPAPGAEPAKPPDFSNVTTTDGPDFSKLE